MLASRRGYRMKLTLKFRSFLALLLLLNSLQACKSRNYLEDDSSTKSGPIDFKLADTEEKILELYQIKNLYEELKSEEKQEMLERFIYAADSVHQITEKTLLKLGNVDSSTKIGGLAQAFQTYRTEFFRTEGLLRIYRKVDSYKSFLKPLFTNELKSGIGKEYGVKQMEDALGKFGETNMNQEFATNMKASPSAIQALSELKADAFTELKKIMTRDWIADNTGRIPYFTRLFSEIAKNKSVLLTNKADSKQVIEIFSDELKEFDAKELDYTDLEEGFHELRRNLRWIPILVVCFDGLILPDQQVVNSGVPEYNETMKFDSVTKGKYFKALSLMRRPKAYKKFPISLFAATAYYAEQIGYIKDILQNYRALVQAYLPSSHRDQNEAEKTVKGLFFAAGYKEMAFSPDLSILKDMGTTKPLILLDYPPYGRSLDEITKGKQKNIFKKIITAIK